MVLLVLLDLYCSKAEKYFQISTFESSEVRHAI
jgi:hypothetical protein